MEGHNDQTLKDITAAHVECPRCGHLQLESSHCTRCGIDIAAALVQKRKEDLLIQKKIRELHAGRASGAPPRREEAQEGAPIHSDARTAPRKRTGFVRELFRRF
jgi:ribosomal protein L37E